MRRFSLIIFTLAAGLVWGGIGEAYLKLAFFIAPQGYIFLRGIIIAFYFAMLALFVIAAALVSEHFFARVLADKEFFKIAVNIKQLPLVIMILFLIAFAGSGILQVIYSLDFSKNKTHGFNDYYFLVDNSGSMKWNDPQNRRVSLISKVAEKLDDDKRIAVVSFNEHSVTHIPLQNVSASTKKDLKELNQTFKTYDSGTDIIEGLNSISKVFDSKSANNGVVVFISDGGQSPEIIDRLKNLDSALNIFKNKKIPVYTIMFNDVNSGEDVSVGIALLKNIAKKTGGVHSTVHNFTELESAAKTSISLNSENIRTLLTKRLGNPALYIVMHILFVLLISTGFAYLVFGVFSDKTLFKKLLLVQAIKGLPAGIIIEGGLQNSFESTARILMCCFISVLPFANIFTDGTASEKIITAPNNTPVHTAIKKENKIDAHLV